MARLEVGHSKPMQLGVCVQYLAYMMLLLFRKSRKLVAVLGPMHERDSMCCSLDCMFCMSRRGGSGLFFFDSSVTEFRALDKQKRGRKQTESESSLSSRVWKHAKGTTSKHLRHWWVPFFTFLLHLTTILHLPSSPSWVRISILRAKSRFTHIFYLDLFLVCFSEWQ